MNFIIKILTVINFLIWIGAAVLLWVSVIWDGAPWTFGLFGTGALLIFAIAWSISGQKNLSLKDRFSKTIWQQFVIKVTWANSFAVGVCIILLALIINSKSENNPKEPLVETSESYEIISDIENSKQDEFQNTIDRQEPDEPQEMIGLQEFDDPKETDESE